MNKLFLSLVLLGAVQIPPSPPQVPPRDAARDTPAKTGTAVIRGRITDRETGEPIARARVTLMRQGVERGDGPVQVRTGPDGRYEIRNLPAGEYSLVFEPGDFRATHLRQTFGETRPLDLSRPGMPRPFSLGDAEVKEASAALWRAFAIEGRVVDESGEPMAGVEVFAQSSDSSQRVRTMGPYQTFSDDRGMFRVFGLSPGRYRVCANPRSFSGPVAADVRDRPIQTCHPAAVIETDAQVVALSNGDLSGVDVRVQRSRAFTASGTALDSNGAPLDQGQVSVVRVERAGGSSSTSIEMRPVGQFIARGLTPGEYAIRAEVGGRFSADDTRERELAYVPFRIETSDVEGLTVVTSKTARVTGRVIFEEDPAPSGAASMRVMAMPDFTSRMTLMGPQPVSQVKPDLTFELSGLFGPSAITLMGTPRDWIVKAVRYNTQDITDMLVEFSNAREAGPIEVVLSNRGARVSGRVTDERGNPAPEARVVLVPADPARWKVLTTMTGGAVPKADGTYQAGPVRAGDYLLAAIEPDEFPRMRPDSTEFFERIAKVAERISLVESDQRTVDLRLTKLP